MILPLHYHHRRHHMNPTVDVPEYVLLSVSLRKGRIVGNTYSALIFVC
jgi:hypothetical protein